MNLLPPRLPVFNFAPGRLLGAPDPLEEFLAPSRGAEEERAAVQHRAVLQGRRTNCSAYGLRKTPFNKNVCGLGYVML